MPTRQGGDFSKNFNSRRAVGCEQEQAPRRPRRREPLVWLDRLGGKDLADGALGQSGETSIASRRSMFTRMASQKPRRPQFMGTAEILGFLAGQRHKPCLGTGV